MNPPKSKWEHGSRAMDFRREICKEHIGDMRGRTLGKGQWSRNRPSSAGSNCGSSEFSAWMRERQEGKAIFSMVEAAGGSVIHNGRWQVQPS